VTRATQDRGALAGAGEFLGRAVGTPVALLERQVGLTPGTIPGFADARARIDRAFALPVLDQPPAPTPAQIEQARRASLEGTAQLRARDEALPAMMVPTAPAGAARPTMAGIYRGGRTLADIAPDMPRGVPNSALTQLYATLATAPAPPARVTGADDRNRLVNELALRNLGALQGQVERGEITRPQANERQQNILEMLAGFSSSAQNQRTLLSLPPTE
jgi:hypothetical protein